MLLRDYFDYEYGFPKVEKLIRMHPFNELAFTKQSLTWHNERDVLTHSLCCAKEMRDHLWNYKNYNDDNKEEAMILIMAAVLHDIGKTFSHTFDDDDLKSKMRQQHGEIGYHLFKTMFNEKIDDKALINTVGWFIRYHMKPLEWGENFDKINFQEEVEKIKNETADCGKYQKFATFKNLFLLKEMDNKSAIFTVEDYAAEKMDFIYKRIKDMGYE